LALAAAYLIALQALLLPLSVAAGGPFGFSLCSSGVFIAGPEAPGGRQNGCPCTGGCGMQCCGHALADPPRTQIVLSPTGIGAPLPSLALAALFRIWTRNPQLARAPPAV
jgi:hypothetical protein